MVASLISVPDIEPRDIFITSANYREFQPLIPGHVFEAFMLADAEPRVLQPCDSTVWVMGEPVVIAWQGAALDDFVVRHTEDSLRFVYDIPHWNCRIELYKEKEYVCRITPASSISDLPYRDHFFFYGLRTPRIELCLRVDPYFRSHTYIYRRQYGTGYQIKLILFTLRSSEEIEIWSDTFTIVNPVLEVERIIEDLSDLWAEFINTVERMFAPTAYGTLTGRVCSDESDEPLSGYRVTVVTKQRVLRADSSGYGVRYVDTECISITDSLGEYTLRLPVGTYMLAARGDVQSCSIAEGVRIYADSISSLNFLIQYSEFARFHWDSVSIDISDDLIDITLLLSPGSSEDHDGLSVYHSGRFIPTNRISDSTYGVSLPREAEQITCYLPGISGRVISLDSVNFSPIGSVEVSTTNTDSQINELYLEDILEGTVSIENEWLPAAYELDRTVIDISELGQLELTRAGLVKSRVFFDDSDGSNDWRAVLVYHEKVVALEENCEPLVFDLGLQTVKCILSENGRYVIAFDAYGYEYRGGDAVHLDTETGETILFDPSPHREYVDPYFIRTDPVIVTGRYNYHPLGHVSNDGRYARLDSYPLSSNPIRFNLFNDKMELAYVAFSETGNLSEYTGNEISSDGSRICLMGPYQDELCLVIANGDGSISSVTPIIETDRGKMITDEEISVIMTTRGNSGVYIYSGRTGELLHQWHDGELIGKDRRVSPNGSHVSYFLTDNIYRDPFNYIVRSLPSGDISFDFKLECDTDSKDKWIVRDGIDLANNGSSLLFLVQNHAGRYILIDQNGLVLWLSPIRQFDHDSMRFCYISDDGQSVAYSDGNYIYILNLNQVSDY